jgi:sortase A
VTVQRAATAVLALGLVLLACVGLWHAAAGRAAAGAQEAMAAEWAQHAVAAAEPVGVTPAAGAPPAPAAAPGGPRGPGLTAPDGGAATGGPSQTGAAGQPDANAAVALLEIQRPGVGPLLGPLFVGEGVGPDQLEDGPGHFPGSALPGRSGNFAVAGHRTTHGGPFGDLDRLRAGDEVHVTDRAGRRHLYRVVEQRIVTPADTWVAGPDPLGHGRPTLTLTTCHPRYSARQRLVVWAELV